MLTAPLHIGHVTLYAIYLEGYTFYSGPDLGLPNSPDLNMVYYKI